MKVTFERVIPNEKSSFRTIHNNSPISEFNGNIIIIPKLNLYVSFPGVEPDMWAIIKVIILMEIWY
ncbi:hypothetical protein QWZ06_03880 [Chryseobacterium tructae]|uniref:hypothetical protein n=1 Tax=Chryseobacterium tructae TaxID=1037380 RepID=UPI0025B41A6F|nr:hypothetical protein [Chryseobacterium tructae]MDN3691454.1 hypothetical protein [Chryseobacterium tructae]